MIQTSVYATCVALLLILGVNRADASNDAAGYVAQVASLRSEAEAVAELERLKASHSSLIGNISTRVIKTTTAASTPRYRLVFGPLPSSGEATKLCDSLIERGEKNCVVKALDASESSVSLPIDQPVSASGGKGYFAQVASLRSEAEATAELERVRSTYGGIIGNISTRINKAIVSGTLRYRVEIGPVLSRSKAAKLCKSLIAHGEKNCSVEALDTSEARSMPLEVTASANGNVYVAQVSLRRREADAEAELERLRGSFPKLIHRFSAQITRSTEVRYGVGFGPVSSRIEAAKLCSLLIDLGERDCVLRGVVDKGAK